MKYFILLLLLLFDKNKSKHLTLFLTKNSCKTSCQWHFHWHSSFLLSRTQQVRTDGILSEPKQVTRSATGECPRSKAFSHFYQRRNWHHRHNTQFYDDVKLYACSDSKCNLQRTIDKLWLQWHKAIKKTQKASTRARPIRPSFTSADITILYVRSINTGILFS